MNYSKQREEILKVVDKNRIHPTAEDVYQLVKKDNPKVSLSTVYRNLNLLAEEGKVLRISMPNGSDRYDGDLKMHHHVVCEKCGKVFDMKYDIGDIEKVVKKQTNVEVSNYQLTIKGICEGCRKSQVVMKK